MNEHIRIAAALRSAAAGVALVGLAACGATTGLDDVDLSKKEGEGVVGEWVHSGFYDRTYTLHLPPGGMSGGLRPLLVVLHGAGGNGASFRALLAPDAATDAAGFITVYPDGIGGTWDVGCACTTAGLAGANDHIFLGTLIRHLVEGLPVDPSRVFVVGFSQGGQLAQRYGCVAASPPAGIASVGALPYRGVAESCAPVGRFPVVLVHGDADPVMRFGGFGAGANITSASEMVERWVGAMGCSAGAEEREIPDGNQDGTSVTVFRYDDCEGAGQVVFHHVRGGGHTWPGKTGPWPKSTGKLSRNLDATAEILRVFSGEAGR